MHHIIVASDISGEELGFGREQVQMLRDEIATIAQKYVDEFPPGGILTVTWVEDGVPLGIKHVSPPQPIT
ncbi:hypothetical protein LCGC14_2523590 [marine sediment metagenome]|uniref:Uncharacterized protein n=1 Tax=marine sediment metagenome TaxID=412755 RepID=A0A0F9DNY3_9ZZZZ